MSNSAVASAKNRRAGIKPNTPVPSQENTNQPQPSGLTLPQVIALIDTRLIKLEKFMNEQEQNKTIFSNNQVSNNVGSNNVGLNNQEETMPSNITEILDEFQQRFLLLAEEINLLKDTLLKLQTYTMDVNKTLLEERINILSDMDSNGERFTLKNEEFNFDIKNEIIEQNDEYNEIDIKEE